jgi:putative ABC transport system ATP-binding protein
MPAQLASVAARGAQVRVDELLKGLDIAEKGNAYTARPSGGQRQRVAIVRALVSASTP